MRIRYDFDLMNIFAGSWLLIFFIALIMIKRDRKFRIATVVASFVD